jgi:protein-disulfide isomerase
VIPDLIKQYVDTGKARYVYREFPLISIHPTAQKASEAAICAGKQGKYWEMNEHLFATTSEWSPSADPGPQFKAYAETLGLDPEAFNQCLDSGEAAMVVRGDVMAGEAMGVNATPYFFINDLPIRGGLPVEAMGPIIDYAAAGGPTPEIVPERDDWHVLGDLSSARAITVAFVDYASPDSAQHAKEILPGLRDQYIDPGNLVYVIHPWAGDDGPGTQAALAAECAGQQGQFWEMHDQIFENQASWTGASEPGVELEGYAQSAGLDMDAFETCVGSEWAALRAQAGSVVGALYGIPGAPAFLFNNGQGPQGSLTLEEFQNVIDPILNR